MKDLIYTASEWHTGTKRYVRITLEQYLMPYVRQTRNSRYGTSDGSARARAYNQARGDFRDALTGILLAKQLQPFDEKQKLAVSADFWVKSPANSDLDNYVKSLLDCCQGILFPNDKQVYQIITCNKHGPHPNPKVSFIVGEM